MNNSARICVSANASLNKPVSAAGRSDRVLGARLLIAVCVALATGPMLSAGPIVRIGYVVPQNRAPQPAAVANLRELMLSVQDWYGGQMSRYGFGRKTFQLETEADGFTPKVHVVSTPVTDATIRTNVWDQTISAATNAGLPIWSSGQVWLLVPEAHLQNPNGSIDGGTALGAGHGSGSGGGVAMLGSNMIFNMAFTALKNLNPYHGLTIPQIGPYPLAQDVSFPWFEGNTISSLASSAQGAAAHELGHALGLGHDGRNDDNFDGLVMGNGLRGWRGSRLPDWFPNEDVQLGYAEALALNKSRFFNPTEESTDTVSPTLTVNTSGTVNPVNGLLNVSFTAGDPSGLSAALLRRNGDTVAELTLSGNSATKSFSTAFYTPGQNDNFTVSVYDKFGNKKDGDVTINVANGYNRAPQPHIDLSRSMIVAGQSVQLNAGQSTDPDGNTNNAFVQWDYNGDGVFDTASTTTKSLDKVFSSHGYYRITARVTDTLGAASISAPLVLQVNPLADLNNNGTVDAADYLIWRRGRGMFCPCIRSDGDINGDSRVDQADYNIWRATFGTSVGGSASAGSAVPEPTALVVLACGMTGLALFSRGARRR